MNEINEYEYKGLYPDINSGMEQFRFKMGSSNDVYDISKKFKYKIGAKNLFSEGVLKDSLKYTVYIYACMINESLCLGNG